MLKKIYQYSKHLFSSSSNQYLTANTKSPTSLTRIIIGNGIAGVEAAKTLRKLDPDCQIIMISAESLLHWSRPALMYIFMEELSFADSCPYPKDWFAKKRIELIHDQVVAVDRSEQKLSLKNGPALSYEQLLVACGSQPKTLEQIPMNLDGVFGFYHLQDCEKLKKKTQQAQQALIVGGGLIAVELAEILLHQGLQVAIVTQDPFFAAHIVSTAEAQFLSDYLIQQGIRLYCSAQIEQLQNLEQSISKDSLSQDSNSLDSQSQDSKVSTKQVLLTNGVNIDTELILLAIGVEPAGKLITGIEALNQRGLVVNHRLQSADPTIFAAGDCAELCLDPTIFEQSVGLQSLAQLSDSYVSGTWYEAKAMGRVVAHSMHHASQLENTEQTTERGTRQDPNTHNKLVTVATDTYLPKDEYWFNSAKFFDIEYQEYGRCLNHLNQVAGSSIKSIYYLSPQRKQSLRLFFKDDNFTGVCSLGIRLRQDLCHTWLDERRSILTVIESLAKLNFDPEFEISIKYAQQALLKEYKTKIT